MRTSRSSRAIALGALAAVLVVTGCTSDAGWTPPHGSVVSPDVAKLASDVPAADFAVSGSIEQVHVSGAVSGQRLALHDGDGVAVRTAEADEQGSLIFREVPPGDDYRVATTERPVEASDPVDVDDVASSTPQQSFYDEQVLDPGFTYITTRDGTTLAASVFLPGPVEDGPYPTVVEYSGYDPARPGTNLIEQYSAQLGSLAEGDSTALCAAISFACDAPAQPSSMLALAMGYAVVAVNVRGTGCSGGAYDFFETLQMTDGYDVIEVAAAQPWVRGNRVGMVGLSYPGISQLFVASMQPPSLAAITPLSVIDDTVRGTLAPGGIFNSGFALSWAIEVSQKAEAYGQGWEQARVDGGDTTCEQNQRFRGQNVDIATKAQEHRYYPPELADPLNPSLFVDRIEVPVYLTGSFQDEQTGGRFPLLFDRFTNAPVTRFTAMNGTHADGYAPVNLNEWKTFLDLYVADEISDVPPMVKLLAPVIMREIFDADMTLSEQRFLDAPSAAAARAEYEAEDPIRLVIESGAGDAATPGSPVPTAEVRTTSWPPPGTRAEVLYLGPGGTLGASEPVDEGPPIAARFAVEPGLAERTTFGGTEREVFHALPSYDWQQEPAGSAAVFVSEPADDDLVFAGSASADLWIRTDSTEADLGVTLSEVRPDGRETFIQAGVLRALHRKVAKGSTELLPLHSQVESDAEELEPGEWTEARVEIFPFFHIVRSGSRIRLSVHTPGGDRPRWTYIIDEQPEGTTIDVGHSAEHPSRLVLPLSPKLLEDTPYPAALPPCPSLRGQPCRDFVPYRNQEVDG